jgi:hypothetical protein
LEQLFLPADLPAAAGLSFAQADLKREALTFLQSRWRAAGAEVFLQIHLAAAPLLFPRVQVPALFVQRFAQKQAAVGLKTAAAWLFFLPRQPPAVEVETVLPAFFLLQQRFSLAQLFLQAQPFQKQQ